MRAKLLRLSGPLLVLVASAGIVALLKMTAPEPTTEQADERAVTVYTHLVQRSDTTLDVHTQGEVRARTAIELRAQVSGRVTQVSPEYIEGGRFDADTVLLQIDDSNYRLALAEAEAGVAAAELGVQQALADAEVAKKQLRNQRNASALALKEPQISEARARREAANEGLRLAQLNLERTKLRLPFRGRITSTAAHIGQVINAGDSLGQVFSTDRAQVRLPLTNQQLSALGLPIGFSAELTDAPSVTFEADVGGTRHFWTGALVRIDAAVDPSTRLIYATAELPDPYGAGRSPDGMPMAVGLFVEATIAGKELQAAVQIPSKGLRPGNQLYVVDASGRLDIRNADVAFLNSDHAVINQGLKPGERLVVSALRNPITGMRLATIDERNLAQREN